MRKVLKKKLKVPAICALSVLCAMGLAACNVVGSSSDSSSGESTTITVNSCTIEVNNRSAIVISAMSSYMTITDFKLVESEEYPVTLIALNALSNATSVIIRRKVAILAYASFGYYLQSIRVNGDNDNYSDLKGIL